MKDTGLSIQSVNKTYQNTLVSNQVSFDINEGSVFGLLGPNGAGKTTLIRMITRITRPDSGSIFWKGTPISDSFTERIGYMPEERGLYKKMKVGEQLIYLAQLKGLSKADAVSSMNYWLERLEAKDYISKTPEELSKGMSQKVQFVSTVIHNPDLIILDEPFSGLDPINSKLIEEEIKQLSKQGKTIIFSTHRLEQVEEFCKEIVLINKGKNILSGSIQQLKQQFKENKFLIETENALPEKISEQFEVNHLANNRAELRLKENQQKDSILKYVMENGLGLCYFAEVLPTLNEIFIKQVNAQKQ